MPYPRDVLLARQRDGILPDFPIWDDVCTLDGNPWRGSVDVLCGGFPCQDISAAGKGAGITGERSGLWKEYARLIGEMRPRFVFAENSPLLRTRGLGVVLEDLAAMGYNARWGIIGAGAVGAPHKRDRMWVLAYSTHEGLQGDQFTGGADAQGWQESDGSATECSSLWWHTDPADLPNAEGQGRGTLRNCEKAEGGVSGSSAQHVGECSSEASQRPEDCTTEPAVGRVAHGVANRVDRIKAIGNGQVPQCAAVAFNILSEGLI
jgi:DNA (cytosine-5)-methyltransferase 1